MSRTLTRCLSLGTGFVLLGAAMLSPVAGCQGNGLGGLMGSSSAMELLSPLVKDAANSYVSNLTSLTSSLANLKDLQGVMDFVKRVEPTVKQLSSSYQTLAGTTGEERSNLMKAFGPKFESANSGFLGQSDRVKSNGMWGQALAPALEKIKLFQ